MVEIMCAWEWPLSMQRFSFHPFLGDLFAACPVDAFPGLAVEAVSDSSRYFVLRLQDPSGRHAFVGMGFQDRGDAFDFNVALQEHFKYER